MNKRQLTIIAVSSACAVIGVWLAFKSAPPGAQLPMFASTSPAFVPTAPVPAARLSELPAAQAVEQNPTLADMKRKGLSAISNPRKFELDRTVDQPTVDCVRDLGDPFTLFTSRPDDGASFSQLSCWNAMTFHIKALRLIGEGRHDSGEMCGLLKDEIHRSDFSTLATIQRKSVNDSFFGVGSTLRSDDPYYKKNRAFEDTLDEYERRMRSAGQCFYILANIGQLCMAEDELAAFAELCIKQDDFPDTDRPISFVAWLIACDVAERQRKSMPAVPALVALTKPLQIQATRRTKWDFGVDMADPMVIMAGVDKSGIPTIAVLALPQNLPDEMEKNKKEILVQFLADHPAVTATATSTAPQ